MTLNGIFKKLRRQDLASRETSHGEVFSQVDSEEGFWCAAAPLIFGAMYFFIGLFFVRPSMGDPDSYRQALSALSYIEEGMYSSYWDFPLTMYFFVAGTRLALAFDMNQLAVLNTMAVLLGAASVWPFYHLIRRIVSWQTAAFATTAYIFSPTLIRYSTYLSHEVVGFAFALWSVYLFELALAKQDRFTSLAFGLFFGAAYAARTNGAAFIIPPLLVLFFCRVGKLRLPDIGRFLLFALLGFGGCLLLVHRPVTVLRFVARLRIWFFTYYEIGQFIGRTTQTAIESLTPVLVAVTVVGVVALIVNRKVFIGLFGGVWILTVYLFYVGMDICRLKFFLVLVPPCLLMVFAGADQIDNRFHVGEKPLRHVAKFVTVLLLLLASLGPSLPELLYLRKVNDDKVAAQAIGELVGRNLLFVTSLEPMIKYYNRGNPPETIYLVTEHTPGILNMKVGGLRLAQARLEEGLPVFATEMIIQHLQNADIDVGFDLAWEYKSLRLFRVTSLKLSETSIAGYESGD